eukprot:617299-Lingulodinium_polyedra.AAC.1
MPLSKGRAVKASACPVTPSSRSGPRVALSTDHGSPTGTILRTCLKSRVTAGPGTKALVAVPPLLF